jgi:hypothetical protein
LNLGAKVFGFAGRSYEEIECLAGLWKLQEWQEKSWMRALTKCAVFAVLHNSDDFNNSFLLTLLNSDPSPHRVDAREHAMGKSLIEQRNFGSAVLSPWANSLPDKTGIPMVEK